MSSASSSSGCRRGNNNCVCICHTVSDVEKSYLPTKSLHMTELWVMSKYCFLSMHVKIRVSSKRILRKFLHNIFIRSFVVHIRICANMAYLCLGYESNNMLNIVNGTVAWVSPHSRISSVISPQNPIKFNYTFICGPEMKLYLYL